MIASAGVDRERAPAADGRPSWNEPRGPPRVVFQPWRERPVLSSVASSRRERVGLGLEPRLAPLARWCWSSRGGESRPAAREARSGVDDGGVPIAASRLGTPALERNPSRRAGARRTPGLAVRAAAPSRFVPRVAPADAHERRPDLTPEVASIWNATDSPLPEHVATSDHSGLSAEEMELLDAGRRSGGGARMELPAILHRSKPADRSRCSRDRPHFFEPFVTAMLRLPDYRRFALLIERREAIEALIGHSRAKADDAAARDERAPRSARPHVWPRAGSRAAERHGTPPRDHPLDSRHRLRLIPPRRS